MFFLSRSLGFGQALRWTLRTVIVRGIPILVCVVLLIAITLLWGLALRTLFISREQQQSASSPSAFENYYEYDVGKVLSGEVVSNAFVFTNTTGELLRISDDTDVRKDCGCAAVEPETRELQPGDSTKVIVKVVTRGRSGHFAHGGTVAWSPPNGKSIEAIFKLHGEILLALESHPTSLGFGPDEVNGRVTKEIKFTASVPLDWANAKVRGYEHDP